MLVQLLELDKHMDLTKNSSKTGTKTLLIGGIHLTKKCLVNLEGILELFIDYSYR